MSAPRMRVRSLVALSALLLGTSMLSACDNGDDIEGGKADDTTGASAGSGSDPSSDSSDDSSESEDPDDAEAGTVSTNIKRRTDVPVSTQLLVFAHHGRLSTVTVSGSGDVGALNGAIAGDGGKWKADDLLEPGTTYTVKASVSGDDGEVVTKKQQFTTQALSLSQQTYPSVAPLPGETVGVGMPVIVNFDVPVTDRANIEKHLHVTTAPEQPGTWHWLSDTEVHYRPKKYWKAGTTVDVDLDINGVEAGSGIYGQEDRDVQFQVGDAHIYKVDTKTDQMKVFSNGKLLRTIPITTGQQPKFTTRSGIKVIIEKFDAKRMNSETVGIPVDSADGYDIDNVQWAMRVTYSGEFVHAAPWSVGSQGVANVSHGCTGMSTSNADWLYHMTVRGDVVDYSGTDRPMEPGNGYGDWNIPWDEYQQGSALAAS
jgi:lipoprotein-anchoring transpeptidase ErfK/SrfK